MKDAEFELTPRAQKVYDGLVQAERAEDRDALQAAEKALKREHWHDLDHAPCEICDALRVVRARLNPKSEPPSSDQPQPSEPS